MKSLLMLLPLILFSGNSFGQRAPGEIRTEYQLIYEEYLAARAGNTADSQSVRMSELLVEMERPTEFEADISANTRQLIVFQEEGTEQDIYLLAGMEKALRENHRISLHLQQKLITEVSGQIYLLSKAHYPGYTYNTRKKQAVKFISIRSGNDLFTGGGIVSNSSFPSDTYLNDDNLFFQRNDNRDYTGSLLVEIGTDYLNTRRRSFKSYQVLLYGFDLYSPYFRNDTIFPADTSFNPKDRPHASFEYIGWSRKTLSENNRYRFEMTLKLGVIGGKRGKKYQTALHHDASRQREPGGWDAQIANGGRVGISFEMMQNFWQRPLMESWNLHPDHVGNMYLSFFSEQKVGTYMTTAGLGVQVSNKTFKQNNHNYINQRKKEGERGVLSHLMYTVSFSSTYVVHNTMLEGYGIFRTTEDKNDRFTKKSRYYLPGDSIQRFNQVLKVNLSYTTRFCTFFYTWRSISPETKLSGIGTNSRSGNEMDISRRWHHFAEIGVTFNVN